MYVMYVILPRNTSTKWSWWSHLREKIIHFQRSHKWPPLPPQCGYDPNDIIIAVLDNLLVCDPYYSTSRAIFSIACACRRTKDVVNSWCNYTTTPSKMRHRDGSPLAWPQYIIEVGDRVVSIADVCKRLGWVCALCNNRAKRYHGLNHSLISNYVRPVIRSTFPNASYYIWQRTFQHSGTLGTTFSIERWPTRMSISYAPFLTHGMSVRPNFVSIVTIRCRGCSVEMM